MRAESITQSAKSFWSPILVLLPQEYNFEFMECSAATGENVIQSLETVARLKHFSVPVAAIWPFKSMFFYFPCADWSCCCQDAESKRWHNRGNHSGTQGAQTEKVRMLLNVAVVINLSVWTKFVFMGKSPPSLAVLNQQNQYEQKFIKLWAYVIYSWVHFNVYNELAQYVCELEHIFIFVC